MIPPLVLPMDALSYVYGLGGVVFVGGLGLARRRGIRAGSWTWVLLAGFVGYALLHALLQSAGEPGPYPEAGATRGREGVLGGAWDLVVVIVYFVGIMGVGAYFARFTKTTDDFFFAGRRFSAWLVALSCVATTMGAYSFVKYASAGFRFGLSSSMSYLNDWFWMPLWMLVWLPIVYWGRLRSIPEYFERRFDRRTRAIATLVLLVYLVGYVGINFLTLGKALHALSGWQVFPAACLAAAATGVYVTVGGQTSVIMTDLVQGLLLLGVGLGLFVVGVLHVGGPVAFWASLPPAHHLGFAPLRTPAGFNTIGVFWQDGLANGVAFYFINQGIMMRFMAARSVREARRAMTWVVLLIMPLAAIAVSGVGWVGRAMVASGEVAADTDPDNVFVVVSAVLATPGVFGLIMATLAAALMSTADTLLTAISAVFVNDVWRPYLARGQDDGVALKVARVATVGAAVVGLLLVPVFDSFASVYLAHAAFVAAVVPPMAVTLLLAISWPRYGREAALLTLVGGTAAVVVSLAWPQVIEPFAQGVDAGGLGLKAHKYMRACFGLVVSGVLGIAGGVWFRRSGSGDSVWVAGPESALRAAFGAAPTTPRTATARAAARIRMRVRAVDVPAARLPGTDEILLDLHPDDRRDLGLGVGDLVYVQAPGRWHGGLRSVHGRITEHDGDVASEVAFPRALLRGCGFRDGGEVEVCPDE